MSRKEMIMPKFRITVYQEAAVELEIEADSGAEAEDKLIDFDFNEIGLVDIYQRGYVASWTNENQRHDIEEVKDDNEDA
jgi:hypothetical protein